MIYRLKRCIRCGKKQHLYGDAQLYCYKCHCIKEEENSREDK